MKTDDNNQRLTRSTSPAMKASMAFLFANIIVKGLSLVSGPVFTRIMSSEQYGLVSTFMSWKSILAVVITFNLSSGVFNNGMLEFKDDRDGFQFSLLAISSAMSVLAFVLFLCFQNQILPILEIPKSSVYLMILSFLFVPAYHYWSGRQRYEYKYKALTSITIISAIVSVTLGIVGVLHVDDSIAAVTRLYAIEGVTIIIGFILFVYIGIKARFQVNMHYCKYALVFNIPLIPHYLSMYILSGSDRIMITKLISTSATAIYSVAYTVASVIEIVWHSIDASLSPWIYEKLDSKREEDVKKITLYIVTVFATLCFASTLLAPEIMVILAPASYSSGVYTIPPVSAGVFFMAMYSIYMRIELFYKQKTFTSILTTVAALTNIILNYFFIRLFGAVAAGYTTMICYALLAFLHYIIVKTRGYSGCINNKAFLIISSFVVLSSIITSLMYNSLVLRLILVFAILIVAFYRRKSIIELIKGRMFS